MTVTPQFLKFHSPFTVQSSLWYLRISHQQPTVTFCVVLPSSGNTKVELILRAVRVAAKFYIHFSCADESDGINWLSWRPLPSFVEQEMLTTVNNYLYSAKYKPIQCLKAMPRVRVLRLSAHRPALAALRTNVFTSVASSNLCWGPKNEEKNSYAKATSSFITDEVIRIVEMHIHIFCGGGGIFT
jgi:hypothetical protein